MHEFRDVYAPLKAKVNLRSLRYNKKPLSAFKPARALRNKEINFLSLVVVLHVACNHISNFSLVLCFIWNGPRVESGILLPGVSSL